MSVKIYGIDVSHHQGKIDWKKMAQELRRANDWKNPGFAIIRAGYSNRSGQGGLVLDRQLSNNMAGCEQYDVPMGVYVYCYDTSVAAARKTAKDLVEQLKGHRFGYPIVYDVEYEPFNTGKDKRPRSEVRETNTAMILAFMEVLNAAGYYGMVYCSRDFFVNYTNLDKLTHYELWEAAYSQRDTADVKNGIWQYSSSNALKIPGYKGLDCDVSYKDYPAIIAAKGLNGYSKAEGATKPEKKTEQTAQKGGFDVATLETLKRGSTGPEVKSYQLLLNGKNNAGLVVDGFYGAKTEAATKAYQKASGLAADGKAGVKTWAHILTK